MAAVRHLEFEKIAVLASDLFVSVYQTGSKSDRHVIFVPNFALTGQYGAEI